MYDDHYGFTGRPFQLTPDPRFWFDTATHRKAMAYLGYGLSQGEGFIVITGDIGAGKTTLVGHLMATIDRERLNVVKLVSTQIEAVDLLRLVGEAMQVATSGLSKAELLTAIERALHASARSGRRTLLIVDEAQALPTSSLEELRMLSNFQAGGHPLLQIFLLGQPEFRERLHGSDRLEQLRQRVIAVHHLDPMGADEIEPYMTHRLRLVGWQGRPRFTQDAYAALYAASDGVPRRLNQIVGRVLLAGAVERLEVIDGGLVERVVADLAGDARPAPSIGVATGPESASTSLGTNGELEPALQPSTAPDDAVGANIPSPFVPSDVEGRGLASEPQPVRAEPVDASCFASAVDDSMVLRQAQGERGGDDASLAQPVERSIAELSTQPVPDATLTTALDRIAALESRVEEQEAALRRMLTLLVDWVEGDGRADRSLRSA